MKGMIVPVTRYRHNGSFLELESNFRNLRPGG